MTLSKVEVRHMRAALVRAIDYEESLIDAHRVKGVIRKGEPPTKVVPAEYKSVERSCLRKIANWRALLRRSSDSGATDVR